MKPKPIPFNPEARSALRIVNLVLPVIEEHRARHGLKEEVFGERAAGDVTFLRRLREGRVTLRILQRALDYMAAVDGAAVGGTEAPLNEAAE